MILGMLGVYAFVLPTVAAVGVAVAAILTVLVALKFRPPAFLWTFWPACVVLAGAFGTWSGGQSAAAAIAHVDPWQKEVIGAAGSGEAVLALAVGLAFGGALSALSALLLGIGAAIGAGREAAARFGAPAVAWLVGVIVFGLAPVAAIGLGLSPLPSGLVGLAALVGALGLGLAALRLPEDVEDAPRSAAAVPLAAALAVGGVLAVSLGNVAWAQSTLLSVMAHVEPSQRAVMTSAGLHERSAGLAVGAACTVAMALAGLPAIGSVSTLLPNARGLFGFVGAAFTAFAALVGGLFAVHSLAALTAPPPYEARVRSIALPNPKRPGEPLAGACLVVANGEAFAVEDLGGSGCPTTLPAPDPLLALAADTPATRLATGEERINHRVLARTPSPSGGELSVVYVAWEPAPPPEAVFVLDEATGERLVAPGAAPVGLADPDSWRKALALYPQATVVLVPGAQWSLQDVLSRCAMLPDGVACVLGPAPLVASSTTAVESEPQGTVASAFKAAVARQQGQIKYCYESALKRSSKLAGRLEVEITVADERVASAVVTSDTIGDRDLSECVTARIARWPFPGVPAGSYVYPFALRPGP